MSTIDERILEKNLRASDLSDIMKSEELYNMDVIIASNNVLISIILHIIILEFFRLDATICKL